MNSLTKLTIPELIKIQAATLGSKEALVTDNQTLTFEELETQSTDIAKHLVSIGVEKGDR